LLNCLEKKPNAKETYILSMKDVYFCSLFENKNKTVCVSNIQRLTYQMLVEMLTDLQVASFNFHLLL
jgi:hypothetical protein